MLKRFFIACLLLVTFSYAYADKIPTSQATSEIVNTSHAPDSVFKVDATRINESQVKIEFAIKPNYYLYAKSLKIETTPDNAINTSKIIFPQTLQIPKLDNPDKLDDVYAGNFSVLALINDKVSYPTLVLKVTIQGCDGKTICYPPEIFSFDIANIGQALPSQDIQNSSIIGMFHGLVDGEIGLNQLVSSLSLIQILFIFFLAGIAISLTPCMYPLYPIALASILGQNKPSLGRVLALVFSYIHGISLVYILIGFLVSLGGVLLTTALQTPIFIFAGSIVWLILGLVMLDLVKINLPNSLNDYLYRKNMSLNGGNIPSVLIMGILSALLLGPCVTPPLIAALSIIVSANDIILGMSALYAISLGMGMPILVIALFGNKIMPKSGNWMNTVKYILGVLIIVVAIYLVLPLFMEYNIYLDLSILSLVVGVIILKLTWKHPKNTHIFQKRLGVLVIIIACVFQVLAIQDKFWQTSLTTTNSSTFVTVTREAELNRLIKASTKPVIIDFYASWCSICREMERTTFKNPEVLAKLSNYTVIKFDLSKNTPEAGRVLRQYDLYGIPALILLHDDKPADRLVGYTSSTQLLHTLNIIKIQHNK